MVFLDTWPTLFGEQRNGRFSVGVVNDELIWHKIFDDNDSEKLTAVIKSLDKDTDLVQIQATAADIWDSIEGALGDTKENFELLMEYYDDYADVDLALVLSQFTMDEDQKARFKKKSSEYFNRETLEILSL